MQPSSLVSFIFGQSSASIGGSNAIGRTLDSVQQSGEQSAESSFLSVLNATNTALKLSVDHNASAPESFSSFLMSGGVDTQTLNLSELPKTLALKSEELLNTLALKPEELLNTLDKLGNLETKDLEEIDFGILAEHLAQLEEGGLIEGFNVLPESSVPFDDSLASNELRLKALIAQNMALREQSSSNEELPLFSESSVLTSQPPSFDTAVKQIPAGSKVSLITLTSHGNLDNVLGATAVQFNTANALNSQSQKISTEVMPVAPALVFPSELNKSIQPQLRSDQEIKLETGKTLPGKLDTSVLGTASGQAGESKPAGTSALLSGFLLPERMPSQEKFNFDLLTEADVELFDAESQKIDAKVSSLTTVGSLSSSEPVKTSPLKNLAQMELNFSNQNWSQSVAEKAANMVAQKITTADIQLDPPELGQLHIRVQVNHDQATVNFVAATPQVRDALDSSLMRLKEMLQEQGLDLVDSNVSDQSAGEGSNADKQEEQQQGYLGSSYSEDEALASESPASQNIVIPWGVDYFA